MAASDRTERVSRPASRPTAAGAGGAAYGDSGVPAGGGRIGSYRLIQEVGQGGMGVVHLALDRRGRAVAVKVLRTSVAADAEARGRLGREVETLSRIRDDRVASVIDADIMGPRPYIVTRFVPGAALDDVVEEHGPLPPDALLRLARGMAEAIRAIHACGVVHRDIKPGNVLLEDGEPVLIDFGIAHLQDDVRHTVGGLVMGTPGYLSPELVEGAPITDATDWWGWAATITYAASGRPPFGRGRMDAVLARVRAGEVDLDGVDPRLQPLLRASLSPDPAERPHADHVISALERFAAGHAATVPTPTGDVWDDPGLHEARPGATQVYDSRGTAALPGVPAVPFPPSRWAPPTSPPVGHGPGPAAYEDNGPAAEPWEPDVFDEDGLAGDGRHEDHEPDGQADYDQAGYEHEAYTVRRGDPRIGLSSRTGLLLALTAAWLGLAAAWPGVAVVALVAWACLARTADRVVTGLVLRRHVHGVRRTDLASAVLLAPWHLVLAGVATALSVLLAAGVALGGVALSTAILAAVRGEAPLAGSPLTLAAGGAAGLLTLWCGPGCVSLRRGSRSMVRGLVPEGTGSRVVSALLVTGGAVVAWLATSRGASFSWTPFAGAPFGW